MANKVENLFVCTTVFQLFLARKIIGMKKIKSYEIIYLKSVLNKRELDELSRFKRKKIIKSTFNFFIYVITNSLKVFNKIYISSINEVKIWTICSFFSPEKIYSFDDGSANYIESGYFFDDSVKNLKQKIILKLFRVKYKSLDDIKSKIYKHYGLLNLKNIVSNIELLSFDVECTCKSDSVIRIFVAPNFDEFFSEPEIERKKYIALISIKDFYISHPRDNKPIKSVEKNTIKNINNIEVFIDKLIKRGVYRVELFGYSNTTQLFYSKRKEVFNFVIKSKNIKPKFNKSYLECISTLEKITSNKINYIDFI